ncbi:MAG TPA: alpha/beta hydrolase [Mycobacterium sp.]|nr:alpha/beta hydrolase [Mycobacterium sp.]
MDTVELTGGTIHYETAGPATGRPVVFVHGYAMGGSLWRPLARRLARNGLRCIAPTWPLGAHQQAMRPSADLTMRGVATMVAEFLNAAGLDDVVLVGNDTGGAIAQVVATEFPERLGALVLTSCDAFEHFPPPIIKPLIAAANMPVLFWAGAQTMRSRTVRRRAYGALSHGNLDALTAEWTQRLVRDRAIIEDLRRFTGSLRQQTTLDAAARLPRFTKPALVAWSADDVFFPQEDGRRLAAALPNSRLEVIDNARTYSMLDQPDALAALIVEFATAAHPVGRGAGTDRC